MDRVAVFVDAGYLFAAGSEAAFGRKLKRSEVRLDQIAVVQQLRAFATTVSNLPLLRIYWYDGTSGIMSTEQIALARCSDVKMRLGALNSFGQQKGVDSLIITDMIGLARNRAMADAVLLSGDEDIRVGMQQAQEWGVRVHLLGIDSGRRNQSAALAQESDTCASWTSVEIKRFLSGTAAVAKPARSGAPVAIPGVAGLSATRISAALTEIVDGLSPPELRTCGSQGIRSVPADIDSRLLGAAATAVRRRLTTDEKRDLRKTFLKECRSRIQATTKSSEGAT